MFGNNTRKAIAHYFFHVQQGWAVHAINTGICNEDGGRRLKELTNATYESLSDEEKEYYLGKADYVLRMAREELVVVWFSLGLLFGYLAAWFMVSFAA